MPDTIRHQAHAGRRSWLGYARILRSIHDGVDDTIRLAAAHHMRQEGMRCVLRRMSALGLVHLRCAKTRTARWGLGKAETPVEHSTNQPLVPNLELVAFATMVRAMCTGRPTVREIATVAGLNYDRVREFLHACREELRCIHIVGYHRWRCGTGGSLAARYAWGYDIADVAKPPPMPVSVLEARYRARKRARIEQAKRLAALSSLSSIFRMAA